MFTIAHNTIRELVRNTLFSLILSLGIIFVLISSVLETLAFGAFERVLSDFGLSFIELSGLMVILFLGGGMIAREIEGRTIFLILSKPIPRYSIFLGKFFGFSFVVFLMFIIQSGFFIGVLIFHGFSLDHLLFPALCGIFLKLISLLAVILFFSSFVSPLVALFLTISTYIIGHSGFLMLDYAGLNQNPTFALIGRIILSVFPNLESLNLKSYVATDAVFDIMTYWTTFGVNIIYIITLLCIGAFIFSKKSFDNA